MMTARKLEVPYFDITAIPMQLRDIPRWAPWKLVFNEKRGPNGKYDKIPLFGLSTAKPQGWFSFDTALQHHKDYADLSAGLGFCITGLTDLVMVDLDSCLDENEELSEFAQGIVDKLDSYTEISPSGRGLRIVIHGNIPFDWTNHDKGIEVYAGHENRFLTITGNHWLGTPATITKVSDDALASLADEFGKARKTAEIIDLNIPDLVDELTLPSLDDLGLPADVYRFLERGDAGKDRSNTLHAAGMALYAVGLSDAQVLSVLASNEYAMEVALDHRRQDPDRALMYLWREHCLKAKSKGLNVVAQADEFEVIPEPEESGKPKFEVIPAAQFAGGPPPRWIVRDVLPEASLCVVYGESGSGKSFFVLDLVAAIARGTEWQGKKVKQGKVVYVAAEGAGGFRKRLTAYAQHNEIDLADVPLGIVAAAPNLLTNDDLALSKAIELSGGASVIVVDTLAQSTPGGNENSSEDMGRAAARCQRLHASTGALVVLVHHSGKDTSKGARGWSGLRAAVDAELEVSRIGDYRQVKTTKQKDGDDDSVFPFKLDVIEIGQDEDNFAITSCVLDFQNVSMPVVAGKKLGKWESKVFEVVSEIALGQNSGIEVDAVITETVARSEPPEEGKRDTRKQLAKRALMALCTGDDAPFFLEGDSVTIL